MWVDIEHEGRHLRLCVEVVPGGTWVGYPGGAVFLPRRQRARVDGEASDVRQEGLVRAPMTGRVVQVCVSLGDKVQKGDALVVLEAMKMEYRLTAPCAGTVKRLCCVASATVELGDTLVEVDA